MITVIETTYIFYFLIYVFFYLYEHKNGFLNFLNFLASIYFVIMF